VVCGGNQIKGERHEQSVNANNNVNNTNDAFNAAVAAAAAVMQQQQNTPGQQQQNTDCNNETKDFQTLNQRLKNEKTKLVNGQQQENNFCNNKYNLQFQQMQSAKNFVNGDDSLNLNTPTKESRNDTINIFR
jgi:hypothetical protein